VRGLAEEFPGARIEDRLMRRASVAADGVAARGQAVVERNPPQRRVVGQLRDQKYQRDVHHDIDEQRLAVDDELRYLPPS